MPVVDDYTALLGFGSWTAAAGVSNGPIIVSYSLLTSVPIEYVSGTAPQWYPETAQTFRPFSASEAAVVRSAFAAWEATCGIRFVEVPSGQGDINISTISFASDPGYFQGVGLSLAPGYSVPAGQGEIFIDHSAAGNLGVILHEIGHAIGFKHTFEGTNTLNPALDNPAHSVMTYNGLGTQLGTLDVQAAQFLYGTQAAEDARNVAWDETNYILTQTGTQADDSFVGISVRDVMIGNGGVDRMKGMSGNDDLLGGQGGDILDGGEGNDLLDGGEGDDELSGGKGDDTYRPGIGNDKILESNYYIYMDTPEGIKLVLVTDNDMVDYRSAQSGIALRLGVTTIDYGTGFSYNTSGADIGYDYLSGIEIVFGGQGRDAFTGDGQANSFFGYRGRDNLLGMAGDDIIVGDGAVLSTDAAQSIRRLYLATLGRGPDDDGWAGWTKQLGSGQSLANIASGFVGSPEFVGRYGLELTSEQFITLLYRNIFHREPDTAGLTGWTQYLAQGHTRAELVIGLSESAEFRALSDTENHIKQVYRLYLATLNREADFAGLKSWSQALDEGADLAAIAGGFVNSAEFVARYGVLSDSGFVQLLYQNVLGRTASDAERDAWLAEMAAGKTRTQVVLGFSESLELIGRTATSLVQFMRLNSFDDSDIIEGGAGSDRLGGGFGADTFIFRAEDGGSHDHVYDWEAWDIALFGGLGAQSPLNFMIQNGSDVVYSNQNVVITFHGATLADFTWPAI